MALTLMAATERPEVWHQAGGNLWEAAAQEYRKADIEVRLEPFIEIMAEAYGWADLVLCRSGALTVAELAAAGVGAILVPFPYAVDDHQTVNGRFLEREGAAVLIPQSALTAQRLAELLGELLNDRPRLHAMAEAARRLARTGAAQQVAEICLAQTSTLCRSR
jgi:UDP-N-acetylglucosamine--N-acetylmuramyl-(pentapeptide) pyrophosphoryl-undecaprenol N-acetylglucosamine transferase